MSSSVRLSSVTFVRPTQAIEILGSVSTTFGTLAIREPWPFGKNFAEIVPGEVEPLLRCFFKHKRVAEYSNFVPIERYISETLQDRSYY